MQTIGIYIDGPNIDMGLKEHKEILYRLGTIFNRFAKKYGEVVEKRVFIDEEYNWNYSPTKGDLLDNSFTFIESEYPFGTVRKSLTDPSMHCYIIDRLHDEDCPEILMIATADKDISIVLKYIKEHNKNTMIVTGSQISNFLVKKCEKYGIEVHSIQLFAKTITTEH